MEYARYLERRIRELEITQKKLKRVGLRLHSYNRLIACTDEALRILKQEIKLVN